MMHLMRAVTLAVRAMPEAITFYTQLGFTLVDGSPRTRFSTLQAGAAFEADVVGAYDVPRG